MRCDECQKKLEDPLTEKWVLGSQILCVECLLEAERQMAIEAVVKGIHGSKQ